MTMMSKAAKEQISLEGKDCEVVYCDEHIVVTVKYGELNLMANSSTPYVKDSCCPVSSLLKAYRAVKKISGKLWTASLTKEGERMSEMLAQKGIIY